MTSFTKDQTISDFQAFNKEVYGLPDDRMYSVWDLLTQTQRFSMRALKGIRKADKEKLKKNLLVAFSFLFAISSRLHIDIESELWKRFPAQCSYCAHRPCVCSKIKPLKRPRLKVDQRLQPHTVTEFQTMFGHIYPADRRTLSEAGVHLAEEIGEVTEAIHNFLGQHKQSQFEDIVHEISDCISCMFGVASSARINVALELEKMFYKNCHVCHKAPCRCTFATIAKTHI